MAKTVDNFATLEDFRILLEYILDTFYEDEE